MQTELENFDLSKNIRHTPSHKRKMWFSNTHFILASHILMHIALSSANGIMLIAEFRTTDVKDCEDVRLRFDHGS